MWRALFGLTLVCSIAMTSSSGGDAPTVSSLMISLMESRANLAWLRVKLR